MIFTLVLLTAQVGLAQNRFPAKAPGQNLPPPAQTTGALTSIDVTLFGQSCKLEGAFPAKTLEQIHAISPAQIPVIRTESEANRAVLILESAPDLPSGLKAYHSKMLAYAKTRREIAQAIQASLAAKKSDPGLVAMKAAAQGKNLGEFRMRLELSLKKSTAENLDLLWESVETLLEPRPEPDFHRAIFRLKVNYQCEFGTEE